MFVNDQSPTIDTIYWSKDGKKIKTLEGGDKYSEGSTEDPSLFIQNVNCHDVGTYQLTAINAVGSTESNIVLGKKTRIRCFMKCFERSRAESSKN